MFIDSNHSIFKSIKNSPKSSNYDGNIFIVKNKINTTSYNLFSIFNSKKIYIYWDTDDNIIKFDLKLTSTNVEDVIKTDPYLWNFDKYENEYTEGYSYSEKIQAGGDKINSIVSEIKNLIQPKDSIKGGLALSNLTHGNSYYIKSPSDQYLCANKYYKNNDGTVSPVIAVSIDSILAINPNKNTQYYKKFIRASINLVDTKYNIYKKYSIDDDILWKLEINKDSNTYQFYNIKHNIYISIDSVNQFQISQDATSSVYFNLRVNTNSGSKKLGFASLNLSDKIYRLVLLDNSNKTNDKWIFKNPLNYNEINPYKANSEFKQLENGKIYRIINKGVKQNNEVNTYLTLDSSEMNYLFLRMKNYLIAK